MKRRFALLLLEGLLFAGPLLASHAAIITFDANGGQGTMDPLVFSPGTEQGLPRCAFTEAGSFFLGWALSADGYATLLDGDSTDDISVDENGEITLYAVWRSWSLPLYAVLDLSAGSSASAYPVSYFAEPPSGGFNVDAYKTTKLVLRFINPGSFMMRGQYETMLTHPFYIGVFEMTQKQYQLIMGNNPSNNTGDKRPVDSVTYNNIRGSSSGAKWPSSGAVDSTSLLGKLRARTGLYVDLPTEAQWEYACRAGTTSSYNNGGNTEADLKKLGRYGGNKSDGKGGYTGSHTTVGSYLPNAWGLYDMHGNVYEWCLDWCGNVSSPLMDPKGASSGSARILRGGCFGHGADACASSYPWRTDCNSPSYSNNGNGVRLAMTPSVNTDAYAVRFDANGGEGAMMKMVFLSGENAELPAATYSREGHTFVGWATSADGPVACGDGEIVAGGFDIANDETITLYARWSEGAYTVHFDANGGTGTMPDQTLWFGIPGSLAANAFSCNDLVFSGWAIQPDGLPIYEDRHGITNLVAVGETITLYAVWSVAHGLTIRYYDISSSGYSTWTQSENAMADYFSSRTATIEANSLGFGETLEPGFCGLGQDNLDKFLSFGMTGLRSEVGANTNRFHEAYGTQSKDYFAAWMFGWIEAEETGTYSFAIVADDYNALYIDDILVCNSQWNSIANGNIALSRGLHRFSLAFYEIGGGHGLAVQWKCPSDTAWSPLPQSVLYASEPYILTLDTDGGSGGSTITNIYGAAIAPPPDPTRTGYTFTGWEPAIPATMPASNVTCRAQWTPIRYTVHFNANGGTGEMTDLNLSYDETAAFPASVFLRENRFSPVGLRNRTAQSSTPTEQSSQI